MINASLIVLVIITIIIIKNSPRIKLMVLNIK